MADENPFAKYAVQPDAVASVNPFAKYVSDHPEVSTAEDVAKTAAPSLLRGAIGTLTTPGTLSDLVGKGAEWAINKIAPDSKAAGAIKFLREIDADPKTGKSLTDQKSFFPTYDTVKDKVEDKTGSLYDAVTPVGKGVQTGLEVGSSVAGGSVLGTLGKMAGAGTVSGLLGEGAKALGNAVPAWAEPAVRAVGAMIGTGVPAAARRVVTPLPMTPERLATVNALKATNPELVDATSAGLLTGSPRAQALEARSPRMADLPEKQAEAYTQGVMRQAGSKGMFDTAGLQEAKDVGHQLQLLRDAHSVSPAEMTALKTKLRNDYVTLSNHAGRDAAKPLLDFAEEIRLGPNRGTPNFPTGLNNPLHPTDIPGKRVADLLQKPTDASPSSVQQALITARKDLLDAFHNSMPAAKAAEHADLSKKYSNYKTIENIPVKADQKTISPDQVFGKAPRGSDLEKHATEAASIMKPLPKPNDQTGIFTKTLGGALPLIGDTLFHGAPNLGMEAPFMSYYGFNHFGDYVNALKTGAGKVASRPGVQEYLKNQKYRPGGVAGAPDKEMLLRMLMSPPEVQSLPGGSR